MHIVCVRPCWRRWEEQNQKLPILRTNWTVVPGWQLHIPRTNQSCPINYQQKLHIVTYHVDSSTRTISRIENYIFLGQIEQLSQDLYVMYSSYIYIYTFIFRIYILWPNFDVMSNGHCMSQVNQNYSQPMLSHSPTTTYPQFFFSDPPKHVVTFFQAPGRYFPISTCISLCIVTKLWRHVKRPLRDSC